MFELPPTRKCLSCHHPGTMNHLGWWHHIRVTSSTQQIPKVAKTHVFDLLGHLHKGQEKEEYSIGKSYGFSFFKACVRNPELICGPLLGNSDSLYLHVFSALFHYHRTTPNPQIQLFGSCVGQGQTEIVKRCWTLIHGRRLQNVSKFPCFLKSQSPRSTALPLCSGHNRPRIASQNLCSKHPLELKRPSSTEWFIPRANGGFLLQLLQHV